MNTDFEFLRVLERDLTQAAQREKNRMTQTAKPRRRSHRRAWVGAVASGLAFAFLIGILAQGGPFGSSSSSSAGGSFSTVGSAAGGGTALGGGDVPAPAVVRLRCDLGRGNRLSDVRLHPIFDAGRSLEVSACIGVIATSRTRSPLAASKTTQPV